MERFHATVEGGRFIPDIPSPLPDGTRVALELVSSNGDEIDPEYDWPTTQEGIDAMIRELEAIEPAVLTAREEKEIAEFRAACKAIDIERERRRMELAQ